jgi:DNA-directed RNA polymerase specialized sigma24 family protein
LVIIKWRTENPTAEWPASRVHRVAVVGVLVDAAVLVFMPDTMALFAARVSRRRRNSALRGRNARPGCCQNSAHEYGLAWTVLDFKAPSSVRALEALSQGDCRRLLLKYGNICTGSEIDAEDLLSETLQVICDPEDRPWHPSRGSFLTHARLVMRDLARKWRLSAQARREVPDDGTTLDEMKDDLSELTDDAVELARQNERDKRLGALLRQRLDPVALCVFGQRSEGEEAATNLARSCKCSVDEVYDANRRIAYQASVILAEENKTEASRMMGLQKQSKKKRRWAPWRLPEKET